MKRNVQKKAEKPYDQSLTELFETLSESNKIHEISEEESLECHETPLNSLSEIKSNKGSEYISQQVQLIYQQLGIFNQTQQRMQEVPYPHYTPQSHPSEVKQRVSEIHSICKQQALSITDQLMALGYQIKLYNQLCETLGNNKIPKTLLCLTKNGNPKTLTENERQQMKK